MPSTSCLNFRRTILIISLLLLAPLHVAANGRDWCGPNGRGESRQVKGFLVQLLPLQFEDNSDDPQCRAIVRGQDGRVAVARSGHWISIVDITGQDVNGDGQPDAVFEEYGGGAHCCWTYWVVSLGDPPKVVRQIYNQRGVGFTKHAHGGKVTIETLDGSFDYFDALSHADAPFPAVYLRLEGQELKRVNKEFWPDYAAEIREARSKLTDDDIARFRKEGPITVALETSRDADEIGNLTRTEKNILIIVLANLYGGRTTTAWAELHKYWPLADEQRIRSEILSTAEGGFLGNTSRPKYGIID
jgi:hypothetical protein